MKQSEISKYTILNVPEQCLKDMHSFYTTHLCILIITRHKINAHDGIEVCKTNPNASMGQSLFENPQYSPHMWHRGIQLFSGGFKVKHLLTSLLKFS